LPEPSETLVIVNPEIRPVFITPVRRDSLFGNTMHLMGADLDFDPLTVRPDHAGMQRLIHIGLG
jgi:hypothetical protein